MAPTRPLVLLLLIVFFFHSSSVLVTVEASFKLIDKVCRLAQNYEFCESTLRSKPGAESADFNELSTISVESAFGEARYTKFMVEQLLSHEPDPVTKSHLSDCLSYYAEATKIFGDAYDLTRSKDYKAMILSVKDGIGMPVKCEDGFKIPPSRPSPLTNHN